jgi:nucleolar pre-ribosomal-associated protein 1
VINNPRFEQIAKSSVRESLVAFLDALFRKHPQNTCQVSHATPLIQIYGGTLSKADQRLLSIFALVEQERRISVASLLVQWCPMRTASTRSMTSVTDTVILLDPSMVFHSCHHLWALGREDRDQGDSIIYTESPDAAYDPQLLLGFVGQLLNKPSGLKSQEWVELFRTNIFSFVLCCLSAKSRTIRNIARVSLGSSIQNLQVSFELVASFVLTHSVSDCRVPGEESGYIYL